ncbi:uncharacterized protein LOC116415020 [Apis florea]|uniref:uncharacterized protein LOC116415020 n=1 Tax=Apis florea TaxID=7463 RepID=UPI0012FEDF96|nr:uncharacterized protein LOC116415020 [Apis florea]
MDNSHQQLDWQSQNYKSEQKDKSLRNDYVQNKNKFISNEQIKESSQTDVGIFKPEPKLQPRILEVYGGGQYDPTHSDDIYSGVTINPSATLTSTSNTDPWDIREKPEILTTTELVPPLLSVEPLDTNIPTEAPHSSSIWSRISHKIATTIDKAKEKAKNIFG